MTRGRWGFIQDNRAAEWRATAQTRVPEALGGGVTGSLANPLVVFTCLWPHRSLIAQLVRRDILARYRGSMFGLLWSLLNPLLMLAAFTFVFRTVFRARWNVDVSGTGDFALVLFTGLVVYWLFSECIGRAPALMLENLSYVKKVLFPLEILPCVVLLSALFHTALSLLILLAAHLLVIGAIPPTALLLPLPLLPVTLLTLGLSWFLASLGVFLRDMRQIIPVLLTLTLFLSPIFYPVSAVPESFRISLQLNPLTFPIEQARAVLLEARAPNWLGLVFAIAFGWLSAWLGLVWFAKTRKGFADVV